MNKLSAQEGNNSREWISKLPEDLRNHKSLSKFTDESALAKSYLELEKNLEKRIAVPNDDAGDEEWQKIYSKLGMPSDKKYLSDERKNQLINDKLADNDTLSYYEELFAKGGLTRKQSDKVMEQIISKSKENIKSTNEYYTKERERNFATFAEKYKDNAQEKLNILKATVANHGNDELTALIEETNYSPILIDLLLKLGEGAASDSLITGKSNNPVASAPAARKEIKRLESDDKFMLIYNDRDHAGNSEAISRMTELYDLAYNSKNNKG